MRHLNRWGLLLAAALAGGCASGGGAPQDHYYRLAPPAPPRATVLPLLQGLALERLDADTVLGGLPLVYSHAAQPLRVDSYRYFLWTEPPTRLVQRHLAGFLAASGVAPSVYTGAARSPDHHVLSGRLLRFEQQRRSSQPLAVVELELVLRAPDGGVVLDQLFRRETEVGSASIHDTVNALTVALAQIEQEFLDRITPTPR